MTDPAGTPARAFESIDDVFSVLRIEGHRVSTPCRLVLEALFAAEGPISVQRIVEQSPIPEFEPSSAYRNLERLESLGIVRHVHLGHGPSLYMLVGSGEKEFLLCERCGRAASVDPGELDAVRGRIQRQFGYRARFGHFPIVGLCAQCVAADKPGTPA
ncbi:MAG TPA: transcriptional repressor [Solirubrobacterales bacterium]|nr:transcriptional repressor [Solirubrobacterales bacterium]